MADGSTASKTARRRVANRERHLLAMRRNGISLTASDGTKAQQPETCSDLQTAYAMHKS